MERAHPPREPRLAPSIVVVPPSHPTAEPAVDFTDTVKFRSPIFELDPARRDRERILPPGATGEYGGAYKMLRTQVLRRLDQIGATTLGVMSASAGDGKTLTAINLAIAIAADPARTVLLVDFDLRNPSVHKRLGVQPQLGVEDCIEQHRPLQEAMLKIAGYERMTILPAQHRLEHSSEILSSSRVGDLVAEMRARYANRILIFDVPPVLQADDALAFSKHLQAALLVIGEGRTRRENVTRTLELMRDVPFVGTVLNGSRTKAETYY
jgi:Mrp family chromosome partitioning ATPase